MKKNIMRILVLLLMISAIGVFNCDAIIAEERIPDWASDNFGTRLVQKFLGKYANQGDRWSEYRLAEFNKCLDIIESAKDYDDTSWWNPIKKMKTLYTLNKERRTYIKLLKVRKDYEIELERRGISSKGANRFEMFCKIIKMGEKFTFSPAVSQGSKVVQQTLKVENEIYETSKINGWLHPIKKYKAIDVAIDETKVLYKESLKLKDAIDRDPIIKVVKTANTVIGFIKGLFGGNKAGRIVEQPNNEDYVADQIINIVDGGMKFYPDKKNDEFIFSNNNLTGFLGKIFGKSSSSKNSSSGRITDTDTSTTRRAPAFRTESLQKIVSNSSGSSDPKQRMKTIHKRYMELLKAKNPDKQELYRLKSEYKSLKVQLKNK